MRRMVLIGASFLGSAFFLWLVLRDVPLAGIADGIRQAEPFWLLVNFVFLTLGLWTRGVRWRGLLDNRVPTRDAFLLMGVTFMLNQLPLRAGEVARSALVTRHNVPFLTAVTSVVIERILDLLIVVVVLAVALPAVPNASPEIARGALTFGGLALLGFVALLFFATRPHIPHAILAFMGRIFPFIKRLPLEKMLDNVLQGITPLTRPRIFAHAILWTILSWACSFISGYTLTRALGVPADLQVLTAVLGICFTALGLALPLSVASLGPFQGALAVTGELLGLDSLKAITLGFLFNGMAVLGYIVWGTIGLFVLGLSLGDVFKQQSNEKTEMTN